MGELGQWAQALGVLGHPVACGAQAGLPWAEGLGSVPVGPFGPREF